MLQFLLLYFLLLHILFIFRYYVQQTCANVLPNKIYLLKYIPVTKWLNFLKLVSVIRSQSSLSSPSLSISISISVFCFEHFLYILKFNCFMNPLILILEAAVVTATRGVVSMAAVEPVISSRVAWMASRATSASAMSSSSDTTDAVSASFSAAVQVTPVDSTISSAMSVSPVLSGVSARTEIKEVLVC